jgi:hypothetical protein
MADSGEVVLRDQKRMAIGFIGRMFTAALGIGLAAGFILVALAAAFVD